MEGALVVLLDAVSVRLRAVLSGPGGRYAVRLPEGVRFRLRVERIGYATTVTPPVMRERAKQGTFDVSLPVQAISLEPIVATGAGRCVVDPRTAEETAILWDQARKTLEVTALVHRERLVRFHAVHFGRALAPDRSVLLSESLEQGAMDRPFRSLPAAELDTAGWARWDGEHNVYYMPDPEVALSDDFLDGHCFHVAVRDGFRGRQVGLAFEPLAGRRLPDVSGVLWLDGRTAELRSLEYGYTGLGREEVEELAGGQAEFEQLANGVWVVRRWHITMPILKERKHFLGLFTQVTLSEVQEEGGEVVEATDEAGRILTRPGPYELVGEVRDGDSGRPLDGATVRLSGTPWGVTTGSDGAFRFRGLSRGEYLLTFTHPLQDTLGVRPEVRR
ncbi:MAG TPA: carboxypeptidase regulatory-like domain-containing protein, partial [Longimicrobiales bacterium]|nr:carboxypeptidase regulatory-like domain-containing protein [Longimicrobiales bacterium]